MEQRSADFGDASGLDRDATREDFIEKTDPIYEKESKIREKSANEEKFVDVTS